MTGQTVVPINEECRIQAGLAIDTKAGQATLRRAADAIERLTAENTEIKRKYGIIGDTLAMFHKVLAERDALAAQVMALKENLKAISDVKAIALRFESPLSPQMIIAALKDAIGLAKRALSLDTSAAEQILREREAKELKLYKARYETLRTLYAATCPSEEELDVYFLAAERREGK